MNQVSPEEEPHEIVDGAGPDPSGSEDEAVSQPLAASPTSGTPAPVQQHGQQPQQPQQPQPDAQVYSPQYAGYPGTQGQPYGTQQYPAQGYVPPAGYPAGAQYPPAKPPMNVFAIVSFVGSFFFALVGIIFGHIALSKIKRTGESGRGFALAGTIIGYARIGLSVIGAILFVWFFGVVAAVSSGSDSGSAYDSDLYGDGDSYYDEDFEPGFSDMPWYGTENEEFCDALLLPGESEFDDQVAYLESLLPFTEDPDLTGLIEQQIGYAEQAETTETEAEQDERIASEEAWEDARSDLALGCLGEYPAR